MRIDKGKKRNAYADKMGSVIPIDFNEESRIESLDKPFKWHLSNAIGLNFLTFRHDDL